MLPYFTATFGNPSALYAEGRAARRAVDAARDAVAAAIGAASPGEIIFTGSGSEADNLAIKGVARAARAAGRGDHLVVSRIEHHAVLRAAEALEREGFRVTYVPPDADGIVPAERVVEAVTERTVLVSVMLANNEVGTVQPVAQIAAALRGRSVPVHTDAVQAIGYLPVDVQALGVDLLSLSAHKFYGPKGAGALYVRKGVELLPEIAGGGQEMERRAGTEAVPQIVGLAKALEIAVRERDARAAHVRRLSEQLVDLVRERIPGVRLNGHPTRRLPGIVNLTLEGVDAESLLVNLDMHGIAASAGSACSAGSVEPSHVLLAMGLSREAAGASVRFSLGHHTTYDELVYTAETLQRLTERLRAAARSGDAARGRG